MTEHQLPEVHSSPPDVEKEITTPDLYDFFVSAIEAYPGFNKNRKQLALVRVLLDAGKKEQASVLIQKIIEGGSPSIFNYPLDKVMTICRMLLEVGHVEKAKEILSDVPQKGQLSIRNQNFVTDFNNLETFVEHGLGYEILSILLSISRKLDTDSYYVFDHKRRNRSDDDDIDGKTVDQQLAKVPYLLQAFVDCGEASEQQNPNNGDPHDFLSEAQSIYNHWKKVADSIAGDWRTTGYLDHRSKLHTFKRMFNLSAYGQRLHPESQLHPFYYQEAKDLFARFYPDPNKADDFVIKVFIEGLIKTGYEEEMATFLKLFTDESVKKKVYLFIVSEYMDQNRADKVIEYSPYLGVLGEAKNLPDLFMHIRILGFLKKFDLEPIIDAYDQVMLRANSVKIPELVKVLAKAGFISSAHQLVPYFGENYLDKVHKSPQPTLDAFHDNISPDFFVELCSYMSLENRLDEVLDTSFLENSFHSERLLPELSAVPIDESEHSLHASAILSLDPLTWRERSDAITASTIETTATLRHLLIAHGAQEIVNSLIRVLSVLKEKILVSKADDYRALITNETFLQCLSSVGGELILLDLATQNIISESKHLFYLDNLTLGRIHTLLHSKPENSVPQFLADVVKRKTSHIAAVMECVDELELNLADPQVRSDIYEAVDNLQGITPTLFQEYRQTPQGERKDFIKSIQKLRETFYQNKQLTPESLGLNPDSFKTLLSEYIALLFKPVGFTSERIRSFIDSINNKTYDQDLAAQLDTLIKQGGDSWNEEKQCYEVDLSLRQEVYTWKKDKSLDDKTRHIAQSLIDARAIGSSEKPETDRLRATALVRLAKQQGTLDVYVSTIKSGKDDAGISVVATLLSFLPLHSTAASIDFKNAVLSNDPDKIHAGISRLREVIGAKTSEEYLVGPIVADNWSRAASEWLVTLDPRLQSDILLAVGANSVEQATERLYQLLTTHILPKLSDQLLKEEKKLQVAGVTDNVATVKKTRMYISKNVASFFAKAAAGLCTADDVDLFIREDHFHMNAVDDSSEAIIGNTQCYLLPHEGKNWLMIRGLNPTTSFVTSANADGFVQAVMTVAKEIVDVNKLEGLVLCETLKAWHADSNRPEISTVLSTKYQRDDNRITLDKPFNITQTTQIRYVYELYKRVEKQGDGKKGEQGEGDEQASKMTKLFDLIRRVFN